MKNNRSWNFLKRDKRFIISSIILVLVLLFIVVGPLFLQAPQMFSIDNRLCEISLHNLLGCDQNGNDVTSSLVYGGRISLYVGVFAVFISTTLGTLIGLLSGYFGGWFDFVSMRILDIFLAFPGILAAILLSALLGPSYENIILSISLTGWMGAARLVRGEVLTLKNREFVLSAKMVGGSHARLIFRHILPSLVPLLVVYGTFTLSGSIITESSLSFLGLAPQNEVVTWGGMLSAGKNLLVEAPNLVLAPGIMIVLVILSLNLMGDSLRDALDPKNS